MWKKKQIVRKNKEERRKKSQERNKLGGIPPNLTRQLSSEMTGTHPLAPSVLHFDVV